MNIELTVDTLLQEAADISRRAPLVERLARALEQEEIVYSHWKSNINLAQATAGELDLDLLVDRNCLPRMLAILSQLGFKLAVARRGPDSPGISHYYGFDTETDRLIHVHLFSVILTGESLVKSHLFPFEALLLENVAYSGSLRVTDRRAELILFILRTFVKYGSLPDLFVLRRKSRSLRDEARWLRDGYELAEALALLQQHGPVFEKDLFLACLDAIESEASLAKKVWLALRVRRQLKGYARHGLWERHLAYWRLFLAEAQRRLGGKRKNKALQAGGAVIAFVGAEATGKSTLVAETYRWLGGTFAVRTVHAGKPPATVLTAPLRLLLPLLRRGLAPLRTNKLDSHIKSKASDSTVDKNTGLASLVYAVRAVILAWERRQLLLGVRRAVANGDLVICDRYPSDTVGAMDSPRLRRRPDRGGVVTAIFDRLARLEQRLYREIPPPDIVLRLNVSIETAQQRNHHRIKARKESAEYVASRHRHAREWSKAGTRIVHSIDTEQSLAETIRRVKCAIWDSL